MFMIDWKAGINEQEMLEALICYPLVSSDKSHTSYTVKGYGLLVVGDYIGRWIQPVVTTAT